MERGYIRLWRKLQDNKAVYHDSNCLSVFIHLLFMAKWKKGHKIWFNKEELELQPGQISVGRKQLSESTNLSERNIRTSLDKLSKMQIVTIKPTNKFSLITILNWDTYQQLENENDQQKANKRPTSDQRVTTIKELKHLRIQENNDVDFIEELRKNYPTLNLDSELTKMRGWLLSNTNKKRTLNKKFAVNWLNRALDNRQEIAIEVKNAPRPFPKDV